MIQSIPFLSFNQGDSVLVTIAIYSDAIGLTPAVLTAPTGNYLIAANLVGTAYLLGKNAAQVSFSQDPDSLLWTMNVPLSSADTSSLPAGNLFHQAQVNDTDGTTETVISARLIVRQTVTPPA